MLLNSWSELTQVTASIGCGFENCGSQSCGLHGLFVQWKKHSTVQQAWAVCIAAVQDMLLSGSSGC